MRKQARLYPQRKKLRTPVAPKAHRVILAFRVLRRFPSFARSPENCLVPLRDVEVRD